VQQKNWQLKDRRLPIGDKVGRRRILTLSVESNQVSISSTFYNILLAAFKRTDPERSKRQTSHQCLFALLRSAHPIAARKMLVKLSPDKHLFLINVKISIFMYQVRFFHVVEKKLLEDHVNFVGALKNEVVWVI